VKDRFQLNLIAVRLEVIELGLGFIFTT